MMQGRDFTHEAAEADVDSLSPDEEDPPPTKKKRSKNKRRFSDEQVRSLETIFESETKLEPRKKVQVARELGLQPRQVAIWFQNKRARWKSKEMEKNYRTLKSNYDNLKTRLEAVRKDKESLLSQLQELRSVVERTQRAHERRNECEGFVTTGQNISGDHRDTDAGLTAKSSSLQEEMNHRCSILSEDKNEFMAYLKQETELLNIEGSVVSPVKWCSFDAGSLFDQTSTNSHWWESWT